MHDPNHTGGRREDMRTVVLNAAARGRVLWASGWPTMSTPGGGRRGVAFWCGRLVAAGLLEPWNPTTVGDQPVRLTRAGRDARS